MIQTKQKRAGREQRNKDYSQGPNRHNTFQSDTPAGRRIYMYVGVCMCVLVCLQMCISVVPVKDIDTYKQLFIYTYLHAQSHTYEHMYIYIYIYMCVYAFHMYIQCTFLHIQIYTHRWSWWTIRCVTGCMSSHRVEGVQNSVISLSTGGGKFTTLEKICTGLQPEFWV